MIFKTRTSRRGLTIVELLVVLGVLAVLLGIAATAVKTGTRGKKQRETARQVNAFFAGAQARALELGRPVGVELVRNLQDVNDDGTFTSGTDTGVANTCLLMYLIESPPIYAGDTLFAGASIVGKNSTSAAGSSAAATSGTFTIRFSPTTAQMIADENFIRVGDKIRFNYQGERYTITARPANVDLSSGTGIDITAAWTVGQREPLVGTPNFPTGSGTVLGPFPFQIYPQPQRSIVSPLQLPTDMCIDLMASGMGNTGDEFAAWSTGSYNNIRITFNPDGSVYQVYPNSVTPERPIGNLHFLIGKYDQAINALDIMGTDGINNPATAANLKRFIYPVDPDLKTNLADGTSMWVSVNAITGQVTTTRNSIIPNSVLDPTATDHDTFDAAKNGEILAEAREYARRVLTVRGQEGT